MRFENYQDLKREEKAVEFFVNLFEGSFEKLDENDVDFKIYDKEKKLIAFAEIKGRKKEIINAYPLPVSIRKLIKLADKKINPVIIWCCNDGIIYAKVENLKGILKWGGRIPREGAANDQELMAYFYKKEQFKTYKFN
tara:strand:- start:1201 stop:1614 length:414 start_codon:yes stop_codon:yes gene_type:complete